MFRDWGESYIHHYHPDRKQIKLIRSIRVCRTPALGGKRIVCQDCGDEKYIYFSCGNSHCPLCQGIKRLQWQDRLRKRMLKVPYQHITFTLPHDLNGLSRFHPRVIYNLLFSSAWETMRDLCLEEENVGGLVGMTAVLHTWGSDLKRHIHIHCLVTYGGFDEASARWKWPRCNSRLAKYTVVCERYREVFLRDLKEQMEIGELQHYHQSYEVLTAGISNKRWVVNHQLATTEPKVIEEYLGRYMCRIGITDRRLSYDAANGEVRLEYNNYSEQKKGKAAPKACRHMSPLVAINQILQHQLPRYFHRSRHYGLHSSATFKRLESTLPDTVKSEPFTVRTIIQILRSMLKTPIDVCVQCGSIDLQTQIMVADENYVRQHILKDRSPPKVKVLSKAG